MHYEIYIHPKIIFYSQETEYKRYVTEYIRNVGKATKHFKLLYNTKCLYLVWKNNQEQYSTAQNKF